MEIKSSTPHEVPRCWKPGILDLEISYSLVSEAIRKQQVIGLLPKSVTKVASNQLV